MSLSDSDSSESCSSASENSGCSETDSLFEQNEPGVQPYMFEPYDSDANTASNSDSTDSDEGAERMQNLDW